jgi:hypothetical protein
MVHRRLLLAGLGGAALAAPAYAAAFATKESSRIPLSSSYVVNMADQDGIDVEALSRGQVFELRREPDRAFDSNSIAVMAGAQRLGYLPANQSRLLAPLIDAGFALDAELVEATHQPRPSARLNLFLTP